MEFRVMLHLQKCLFINYTHFNLWALVTGFFLYVKSNASSTKMSLYTHFNLWALVTGFFLYVKLDLLGHLTKYLSLTVYVLLLVIESARIYLGYYGNLSCRVPELAGFLMLSVLMQMPLLSFFLFNPYLLSTPTELILHFTLWLLTILEIILSFFALKKASSLAKSVYLSQIS